MLHEICSSANFLSCHVSCDEKRSFICGFISTPTLRYYRYQGPARYMQLLELREIKLHAKSSVCPDVVSDVQRAGRVALVYEESICEPV